MCIHPDDPPRPLFGLPRIVSTADDLDFLLGAVDSIANGLTLCTGSLGAGAGNDLPAMARALRRRASISSICATSARSRTARSRKPTIWAATSIWSAVIAALLHEQARRHDAGDPHWRLPFRPDHGHELLDDARRKTHPGYPLIGRLRGLAELRGVMTALASVQKLPL